MVKYFIHCSYPHPGHPQGEKKSKARLVTFLFFFDVGSYHPSSRNCLEIMLHLGREGRGRGGGAEAEVGDRGGGGSSALQSKVV